MRHAASPYTAPSHTQLSMSFPYSRERHRVFRLSPHPAALSTPRAGQHLDVGSPSPTPVKLLAGHTFSLADFRVSSSIHLRVLRLSSNAFLISRMISLACGDRAEPGGRAMDGYPTREDGGRHRLNSGLGSKPQAPRCWAKTGVGGWAQPCFPTLLLSVLRSHKTRLDFHKQGSVVKYGWSEF